MPKKDKKLEQYLKYLQMIGESFTVEFNGSFVNVDIAGEIQKFGSSFVSKKTFCAHNKIKRDILLSDNFGEVINHDNRKNLWLNNSSNIDAGRFKSLTHIDLSSAYTNALKNNKLISVPSFNYCEQIDKKDRLISVGMFAKRVEFYTYEFGILKNLETYRGELANVFFYAAHKTDLIMKDVSEILSECFIFYWFDGIYFISDEDKKQRVQRYLEIANYPYKCHEIEDVIINLDYPKIIFSYKDFKPNKFGILTDKRKEFEFEDRTFKKLVDIELKRVLTENNKQIKTNI